MLKTRDLKPIAQRNDIQISADNNCERCTSDNAVALKFQFLSLGKGGQRYHGCHLTHLLDVHKKHSLKLVENLFLVFQPFHDKELEQCDDILAHIIKSCKAKKMSRRPVSKTGPNKACHERNARNE